MHRAIGTPACVLAVVHVTDGTECRQSSVQALSLNWLMVLMAEIQGQSTGMLVSVLYWMSAIKALGPLPFCSNSNLINFELMDGLKIKIYSDNSQYDLNCLDPKEYPSLKLEENNNPIVVDGNTFKTIISQTAFAISTQELRPLLTGLNFKIVGDVLECIATDSYRLAKKNIKLNVPSEEEIERNPRSRSAKLRVAQKLEI